MNLHKNNIIVDKTNEIENKKKENHHEEDGNAFIFHHISDDYKYTFFDTEYKGKRYNATIYLPVILISKKGIDIFLSNKFYDENEKLIEHNGYFINSDNRIEATDGRFFIDISITKNVFAIFISILIMLLIFLRCCLFYWFHKDYEVPKGFVGAIESVFSPSAFWTRKVTVAAAAVTKKRVAFRAFFTASQTNIERMNTAEEITKTDKMI